MYGVSLISLVFNEKSRIAVANALVEISKRQYEQCKIMQPIHKMAKAHENSIIVLIYPI